MECILWDPILYPYAWKKNHRITFPLSQLSRDKSTASTYTNTHTLLMSIQNRCSLVKRRKSTRKIETFNPSSRVNISQIVKKNTQYFSKNEKKTSIYLRFYSPGTWFNSKLFQAIRKKVIALLLNFSIYLPPYN